MNLDDALFFLVAGMLGTNHLLVRLPGWEDRVWLFWGVQALNVGATSYLLAWGLPGFTGNLRVVNYVFALLFLIRAVQNNGRWGEVRRRRQTDPDVEARKEQIREALQRGEAEPPAQ